MLNFIEKGNSGARGSASDCDVKINTSGKNAYSVSFDTESLKAINNGVLPVGIMVAVQDNNVYFVPSNRVSGVAFSVFSYKKADRKVIQISKARANLDKFEGKYNFHYDETEQAYYIDRKFLLA